ncbi:ribose-phosphate pyrophosphokinase [Terramyces sp. JEL0728]|nr:ribose-phosphate pyrophosphokinase [Terramyces sp. JEL0728]
MRNISIFSGKSHPLLAEKICKQLAIPVGKSTLSKFSNQETNIFINETVRDVDVFIVQSSCDNVNDHFIELLIMISACRTASARKITAVIPCFPYARQTENPFVQDEEVEPPKKPLLSKPSKLSSVSFITEAKTVIDTDVPQAPSPISAQTKRNRISSISTSQPEIAVTTLTVTKPDNKKENGGYKTWSAKPGTLIANMLMAAVDNLYSHPLIIKYIKDKIPNYQDSVIVSPDAGGAKRATQIADKLNMDFALIHKEKNHHGPRGSTMMLVGEVENKDCIIIDDMSDTADTICSAAHKLVEKGATSVVAIITHGILSGAALDRIEKSPLKEVIVSNTVPQEEHMKKCSKIRVMDVTIIFSEAIRRIHNGDFVEDKVKNFMQTSNLQSVRQMKNQRDMQLALSIAGTKDLLKFISGGVSAVIVLGLLARTRGKHLPVAAVPGTIIPLVIAYQADMVYGTKMNRIYYDALEIKKQEGWWFNELMDLPPLMKPVYRRLMDKQNEELKRAGYPPADEWAK